MSFTHQKDNDNYETDKRAWELIKDIIPKDKKIWSPFYCTGLQKEYFKELGFDIIHEDEDFFKNNKGDIVIDNPPFSLKKEILTRLKELDKPFILIIPTCLLSLKWFQSLFGNEIQMIIPTKRLTFKHFKNPKEGYTPPFGSFYYCYKMNLDKDLIFI
jgi:adenine specific DNA methylase Mod